MSGRRSRIVAVQRDRVERGRQPLGRHAVGEQMEALVGAERVAFAREHPRRILVLALEREHARRERKLPGTFSRQLPAQDLAVVLVPGQRDLAHLACRTATSSSAPCGFPCRGSSRRIRRRRRRPASSATCRGACSTARSSLASRSAIERVECRRAPPRPASASSARSCCRSRAMRRLRVRVDVIAAHAFGDLGQVARRAPPARSRAAPSTAASLTVGSVPGDKLQSPAAPASPPLPGTAR